MKKLLTPFLYLGVIALVFDGVFLPTVLIYGFFEQYYDVRGIELWLAPMFFLSWGTLCFWGANIVMARIEDLQKPSLLDHFRQSFFYYPFVSFMYCMLTPFYGGLAQGYALIIFARGWLSDLLEFYLSRQEIYLGKNFLIRLLHNK